MNRPEGWAIFSDGTIVYMGESRRLDMIEGEIKLSFESVIHLTGSVIGIGIKNGHWATAGVIDTVKTTSGMILTLNIDIKLNMYFNENRERPISLPEVIAKQIPATV